MERTMPDQSTEKLFAAQSGPTWAREIMDFIRGRWRRVGTQRSGLWEDIVVLHWSIDRLLTQCAMGEPLIRELLQILQHVDAHLYWGHAGPSGQRDQIEEGRIKLQDLFVGQIANLAKVSKLVEPENLIQFDVDGRMLPTLVSAVLQGPAPHPNTVALLHFLTERGDIQVVDFLRNTADHPCFFTTGRQTMILAGELFPAELGTILPDVNFAEKPLHLTWWLNVNFPWEQVSNPKFIVRRIPLFVRALLGANKATLCLSGSAELSVFEPVWVGWMDAIANALDCRPDQIIFFPQNKCFVSEYEVHKRISHRTGGVRTVSFNSHLLLGDMGVKPKPDPAPTKRFLCFNQRSHVHRAALLLSMIRDGLLKDVHMSFNQPIESDMSGEVLEAWMQTPAQTVDRLVGEAKPLVPLLLDLPGEKEGSPDPGKYIWTLNQALFDDAAVYLATETEMERSGICRFTEKTVKGLAAGIPLIVFGSFGVLDSLREHGFKTFSSAIDESYDEVEDPLARFQQAYAEVRRLHAMPIGKLTGLRKLLRPVLDHNQAHLHAIVPFMRERLAEALTHYV